MKVVIIEDEIVAAQTLSKMINEIRNDFNIVAILQSIEDSVEWLSANPMPDLMFMDIHLADGSSFAIFERITIDCPIIFTTAYNEYALEAFEVNGIDYLLKPINKARLTKAISKFSNFSFKNDNTDIINRLVESLTEKQNHKKSHFLIPHKDKLLPLAVNEIAYIYAELKMARIVTFDSQRYSFDSSLEELMKHLDQELFFRVNRQYIVAHKAIKDISIWFTGKLLVNLTVPVEEKIIVSRAKVSEFKAWYTQDY